jgi:hypothetical protein
MDDALGSGKVWTRITRGGHALVDHFVLLGLIMIGDLRSAEAASEL